MPTIRQLAKLAGVSKSTVSLALHDDPRLSAATRQRIQALAAEYQYRPSRLAQRLFTGKSGILGFISHSMHSEYVGLLFEGALDEALRDSYYLLPMGTRDDPRQLQIILDKLIEIQVEGIILAHKYHGMLSAEQVFEVCGMGIPFVALNRPHTEPTIDHVHHDEQQVAEVAVTHLWELGHRALAICGVWSPMHTLYLRSHYMQQAVHRLTGEAAEEVDAESSEAMQAYLASPQRGTAIIGCSDSIAIEVMKYAHAAGLRIPKDMSILGCGNNSICTLLHPPLTSIEESPFALGQTACVLLKQRIATPRLVDESPIIQTVPVHLVKRDSCAPPPRR